MNPSAWPGIPASFPSPAPATSTPPPSGGGESSPAGLAVQHFNADGTVAQTNTLALVDTADAITVTLPPAAGADGDLVVVASTLAGADVTVAPGGGDGLTWNWGGGFYFGSRSLTRGTKAFYSDGVGTWYGIYG